MCVFENHDVISQDVKTGGKYMVRRGSVFPGLTVPAAGNGRRGSTLFPGDSPSGGGRRGSMLFPGASPSGGGRRGSMWSGLSVSLSNSRRGSRAVNTLGLWSYFSGFELFVAAFFLKTKNAQLKYLSYLKLVKI